MMGVFFILKYLFVKNLQIRRRIETHRFLLFTEAAFRKAFAEFFIAARRFSKNAVPHFRAFHAKIYIDKLLGIIFPDKLDHLFKKPFALESKISGFLIVSFYKFVVYYFRVGKACGDYIFQLGNKPEATETDVLDL